MTRVAVASSLGGFSKVCQGAGDQGRPRSSAEMAMDERQRKANVRLGLILASVALVLALGFVAKIAFLGPN